MPTSRALLALALVASGCATPTGTDALPLTTLEVAPFVGLCLGSTRMGCVQVRTTENAAWEPAELRNVVIEEGFTYRLLANELPDTPANSQFVDRVFRVRFVVSKVPAPPA